LAKDKRVLGDYSANGGIWNTLIDVKRINPLTYIRRKAIMDRLLWDEQKQTPANVVVWQWLACCA
jgi:hypothetical protein